MKAGAVQLPGAEIADLEARLRRPDGDENGHRAGRESRTRLQALERLKQLADGGAVVLPAIRGGINTHVHTSKSFSIFASPSEAAWQAFRAGVRVFGINDHYTLAGHEEFRKACGILGLEPLFSMEAVAMWEEAARLGQTVNDPKNAGRAYFTAKGVTRPFPAGCEGEKNLAGMNRSLLGRNREIARKLGELMRARLGVDGGLDFEQVLALTPHGQPTERHLAEAAARFLEGRYAAEPDRLKALEALTGEPADPAVLQREASLQDCLRDRLIKAGRPAYVPEDLQAFIPIEGLVGMALDLGAVPTYPVLLDPVTPWESDLERLFDRLEALGAHAVEVIPDRNSRGRLGALVACAARRGFPVFNGTEHNTKTPAPLIDKYCFDGEFRPHFVRGARALLGHQNLARRGQPGLVQPDGRRPIEDRRANMDRAIQAAGIDLD